VKPFADAIRRIDQTNRTNEKLAALVAYFQSAPPRDAAWALYLLTGNRLKRAVSHPVLRAAAAEASGQPMWLLGACYHAAGDLSETIALILPEPEHPDPPPLHELIETYLQPMPAMDDAQRTASLKEVWPRLDCWQRFVFHKLISGAFRMGVAKTLVTRALAQVAGVEQAVMTHRLAGRWKPSAEDYQRLIAGEMDDDPARPYPFCLAYPLEQPPEELGDVSEFHLEWKWDGIRAQLIHRPGATLLWSRGEALVTDAFPEVVMAARSLPQGVVIDGELLAFEHGQPLPFAQLQKRLNRKSVAPTLFDTEVPVVFMAYDLLEQDDKDLRDRPFHQRRTQLEGVMQPLLDDPDIGVLQLSRPVAADSWDQAAQSRGESRDRGTEGLMLKRRDSAYGEGRSKGDWWKWKVEPFTCDCVMIAAQLGHGERASLFTDYTFGVWDGDELVPITKAYSGLTDQGIRRVDQWVRQHTQGKAGPVRFVEPTLVFEIAFEGIAESSRHKSGLALRFPRMHRWRQDKPPREADTLETMRALLRSVSMAGT